MQVLGKLFLIDTNPSFCNENFKMYINTYIQRWRIRVITVYAILILPLTVYSQKDFFFLRKYALSTDQKSSLYINYTTFVKSCNFQWCLDYISMSRMKQLPYPIAPSSVTLAMSNSVEVKKLKVSNFQEFSFCST